MLIRNYKPTKLLEPRDVGRLLNDIIQIEDPIDRDKEHFWVIGLTTDLQVHYIDLATLGILNYSLAHAREVFRMAIYQGIDSVIIAHNHPSGNLTASADDLETTRKLIESGKIIGISVRDHIIIDGRSDYLSLRERGFIND